MKNSQHYFVRQFINNTSSFTKTINIPFTPTKMIVHYSMYKFTSTDAGVSTIRCSNLVRNGQGFLTAICDGVCIGRSEFKIGYPIQGDFLFEVISIDGSLDTAREGEMIIDLEFIEE